MKPQVIPWSTLCKDKKHGGLGYFYFFYTFSPPRGGGGGVGVVCGDGGWGIVKRNLALLGKWHWRLLKEPILFGSL